MKKNNNSFLDRLFMALVFVFLYAPIVLLIVFSFNSGNSNMVWKGFSLHWYTKLFRNRLIMQSVYTTLLVSLLGTLAGSNAIIAPILIPIVASVGLTPSTLGVILHGAGATGLYVGPFVPPVVTITGLTGTFTFDEHHDPVKSTAILTYVDGKPELKEMF